MEKYSYLDAFAGETKVGTLALYKNSLAAFEYSEEWLNTGFSISPYSLPLQKKVFMPKAEPFDGVFGVFADSLPDGWARLLVDRMLLKSGENPETVGPLARLAIVGESGVGLLSYRPAVKFAETAVTDDYDRYAEQCRKILASEWPEDLDELFALGSSSGGARPKVFTRYNGEAWIVKFPSSFDPADIGEQEYRYIKCAQRCGIRTPEAKLFPSANCSGYLGVKRFDRRTEKDGRESRIHMISVSGLLETSHRVPALDYNSLMALTMQLTRNYKEAEGMFRLMCFNVFAHNRDDHSKNFSFLYDNGWQLAPAYDLTYSSSIGGEHATCINGNGADPGMQDLLKVGEKIKLSAAFCRETAEEIQEKVYEDLSAYLER